MCMPTVTDRNLSASAGDVWKNKHIFATPDAFLINLHIRVLLL